VRRTLAVLLLPLALLTGACGDDDDDSSSDAVVYGADDSGTTVAHAVGDVFNVALEQCIGCGYTWQLVAEPDAAVVELLTETDTGGPEEEGGLGGEGEHVFHFEATGAGTTAVDLGYFPPGQSEPEERYTLTVEVS
jgi:predicted secreted protein